MNEHRLLHAAFVVLIWTCAYADHSQADDTSFARQVHESPLVLLGVSLQKHFHQTLDNLFNVTFLVQCILKGQPTEQIIQIVQAGSLLGRRAYQKLDVNREYLVFLEPFFDGTYRPADFEDMLYNSEMDDLLKRTCDLSRTYPFIEGNNSEATLMNKCPLLVSTGCTSNRLNRSISTEPATMTTADLISSTTTPAEKDPVDLEALALLLADDPQEKLALDFPSSFNHKSLFSDDETRTNQANQPSFFLLIDFVLLGILHCASTN